MRTRIPTTLAVVLLALAATAMPLVGCSNTDPEKPAAEATGTGQPAEVEAPTAVTADTLLEAAPGTKWELVTYVPHKSVPLAFPMAGPWVVDPQPGPGWTVTTSTFETVAMRDVPEGGRFPNATYALKSVTGGSESYMPRSLTETSVVQYGAIGKGTDGSWEVQDFGAPTVVYPLDMKPGEKRPIFEDANQRIEGVAVAISTFESPAGKFENAVLVRFDYTHKKQKDRVSHHYFVYAPEIGLVAQVDGAPGQESGVDITGSTVMQVVTKLPDAMR